MRHFNRLRRNSPKRLESNGKYRNTIISPSILPLPPRNRYLHACAVLPRVLRTGLTSFSLSLATLRRTDGEVKSPLILLWQFVAPGYLLLVCGVPSAVCPCLSAPTCRFLNLVADWHRWVG